MRRVCCVICCYASTSGMWVHSLFYSGFLPSCQKRTNNPVNNRQHSLKQCVTRWRKEVCLVFFFRIRKCYCVRFINAFILRFCVKTYSEWLDSWLVGGRERMGMGERRDYVNDFFFFFKVQGLLQSSFSLCFSSSSLPGSPPLPHEWSCFSSTPACGRPEALRHKQNTDKNTRHAMCRPVSQNSPNSHSFSVYLHSPCVSFSLFHSHINSECRQRANSLLGTTDTPVADGVITLALSPEYRAADKLFRFLVGFFRIYGSFCTPLLNLYAHHTL